jgi:uridine phosphorylase
MSSGDARPHIKLAPSPSYRRVLTCGAPERAAMISGMLSGPREVARNREYHSFLGSFRGQEVLVTSHGVGAPGAAICFQELCDVGARSIVRLGTAGGLSEDSRTGDLVVALAAARNDGLSRQMLPLAFPAMADPGLALALGQAAAAKHPRTRSGIVLTSDVFYPGPLDTELKLYASCGALAVEMECSALFIVGQLRGARTGAVLALDGNPLKWDQGHYAPGSDEVRRAIERGAEACLEALVSVPAERDA